LHFRFQKIIAAVEGLADRRIGLRVVDAGRISPAAHAHIIAFQATPPNQ